MSLSILLCEGNAGSADPRVLAKILAGVCEVRPLGGKYGMGDRIKARRETLGDRAVCGILDGDFREWSEPQGSPLEWIAAGEAGSPQLGWRWERKEIENYLIDPHVVKMALGDIPSGYNECLNNAASQLCTYQAARIAVSLMRPRFKRLSNSFGKKRTALKHEIPENLDEDSCLSALEQMVTDWNGNQSLDIDLLKSQFHRLIAECKPDGLRHRSFLVGYAGKDLLVCMSDGLKEMGFAYPLLFVETILTGIATNAGDVYTWLPEWRRLRELIVEF